MTLPEPLTPADLDLRDFAYMPVDIGRLFGSQFHALGTDAEWRAGVTLWLKSYHQVPGASIPDDDVALARLAEFGRDTKGWRKVRAAALRGWVKCTDGRLYHPVVAEKALEGWLEKLTQRKSSGAGNAKRWGSEFDPVTIDAAMSVASGMLRALNPQSRSLSKRPQKTSRPHPTGTTTGNPAGTPKPMPHHSQEKGRDNDVAEDAREPLVSDQARDLADELLVIAGHELRFIPPGWCGAAMRVHTWLANGWSPEIIVAATRSAAAKKHGAPANSVQFFEKAIAEEIARQAAPLPQVEVRQPDKLTVIANGKSESLAGVAARLAESGVTFGERPRGIRTEESGDNVRLLSKG